VDTIARIVDAHEPPAELSRESLAEAERWARDAAETVIAAGTRA
jgi:1-deoxy-D-xylulose-5-phosphate reductoisomerase